MKQQTVTTFSCVWKYVLYSQFSAFWWMHYVNMSYTFGKREYSQPLCLNVSLLCVLDLTYRLSGLSLSGKWFSYIYPFACQILWWDFCSTVAVSGFPLPSQNSAIIHSEVCLQCFIDETKCVIEICGSFHINYLCFWFWKLTEIEIKAHTMGTGLYPLIYIPIPSHPNTATRN